MESGKVGNMEDAARKRRERIKAMRMKQKIAEEKGELENQTEKVPLPKPELKLRSYEPTTEELKEAKAEPAKPGEIETQIKDQLEGQKAAPTVDEDIDLFKLAPRKPDWDLKRDIQKKLDKLEKRTQHAIAEIIRKRLKEETDPASFAGGPEVPTKDGYTSD